MVKRPSISKADRISGPGAELLALCQRITDQGMLTEEGIKDLIRWLRDNKNAKLPAKDYLTAVVVKIVTDRAITPDERLELYKSIEAALPTDARKAVVQRRKERAATLRKRAKLAKQEQKEREREKREQALAAEGVVLLTAKNGRKYQLHALVGLIEYGHESLEAMASRLGNEVVSIVAQEVKARERQFAGRIIRETEGGAWLFRSIQGGDFFVPIQGTRIVSGVPPGPLIIAVPPSLAADIDRQTATPRNMLEFTTQEVAERFTVSVESVRKWIRDGLLGADAVGDGSAAFEYRIPEEELQRFEAQHGRRPP